ncbi:hypothetical protein RJT34_30030 [Clitoria ternatea]|uniref:Uncharacterized protein n=1 Tax=Clitoria ternatea TaxID=43366 RepID=A0AAN9ERM8_CLITE
MAQGSYTMQRMRFLDMWIDWMECLASTSIAMRLPLMRRCEKDYHGGRGWLFIGAHAVQSEGGFEGRLVGYYDEETNWEWEGYFAFKA